MIPSYLPALANHLWQSTLFAAAAWPLTMMLRDNGARVRHAVWLAASIKFLMPMTLLIGLGGQIHWRTAGAASSLPIVSAMDQVSAPFTVGTSGHSMEASPTAGEWIERAVAAVWLCGMFGLAGAWWIRLMRIRSALRSGISVRLDVPVRAVLSPAKLEPGVVGIVRPMLLLPEGIFDRLTPPQMATVIAHELCHVRNHDNLAATIQMFVETVFWFHPLVWWIGKRMQQERERACDEEVLSTMAGKPHVYADAILGVCRMYMESPLECVAGVAGSDLRKRIEAIMENRKRQSMNYAKKALLWSAAIAAVLAPVAIGVANAPAVHAQTPSTVATVATAGALMMQGTSMKQPDIGTFVNGRYHHTLTGTEFSLPAGWALTYQAPSSGGGEQVGFTFTGDSGQLISAFVWMKKQSGPPDSVPDQLRSAADFKAGQRQAMFADYRMLKNTVEQKTVSGQNALSIQAHFVDHGENMIEYSTWAISAKTSVYISVRMRQDDFDKLRINVDQIIDTLLIP